MPGQTSFDLNVHRFEPQTDRSTADGLTGDGQLRNWEKNGRRGGKGCRQATLLTDLGENAVRRTGGMGDSMRHSLFCLRCALFSIELIAQKVFLQSAKIDMQQYRDYYVSYQNIYP